MWHFQLLQSGDDIGILQDLVVECRSKLTITFRTNISMKDQPATEAVGNDVFSSSVKCHFGFALEAEDTRPHISFSLDLPNAGAHLLPKAGATQERRL